jgi:nitrate reductase gamma subunit
MAIMGKILIAAAYGVFAVFLIRFFAHWLIWRKAVTVMRFRKNAPQTVRPRVKAYALTVLDVVLFGRLLMVNPALWVGEWVFHVSFLLVALRHLRFFLNPVPSCIWWVQMPGLIAGYILPLSLVYILFVRLLTKRERYASPANVLLLALVLTISLFGVAMHVLFTPNLVDVKLFVLGILSFAPAALPESTLFSIHLSLVLVLIPFLPTHIFFAPIVMTEARKREQALHLVMHEK